MSDKITWEQAVQWLREQPEQAALVEACYYDDPLLDAAERFADSPEWQAVLDYLPQPPGYALDIGAGRGISSYALARDGWRVAALEPDPSPLVGGGAIRQLATEAGLPITVHEEYGEKLPFPDDTFSLVYGRQVLHHAQDLPQFCREAARVLKPGGTFIATREHVISRPEDLPIFLQSHPLHDLYGGEHAYLLADYMSALQGGFQSIQALGPYDSPINYFPTSYQDWYAACTRPLARRIGRKLTRWLTSDRHPLGPPLLKWLAHQQSVRSQTPGRLYTFIATLEP